MAKPKKADVVAKLEAAKIAFDPKLTVDELVKLLPQESAVAEDPGPTGAVADAEVPAEPEVGGKGSATVYAKNGMVVRTYTKEDHGKDYKELAKGYASKIGGTSK